MLKVPVRLQEGAQRGWATPRVLEEIMHLIHFDFDYRVSIHISKFTTYIVVEGLVRHSGCRDISHKIFRHARILRNRGTARG